MKLSIIIPVYNEAATIREVLQRVRSSPLEKEIVIVDDGSTDGTRDLLASEAVEGTRVLLHPRNQGKGMAIRTGLKHATGDYVLIQDADLEYDPADYELLIRPILRGKATVVYGSRFLGEHKAMLFWHSVGNRMLTLMTNVLYDTTLTDMETCYKVFPSRAYTDASRCGRGASTSSRRSPPRCSSEGTVSTRCPSPTQGGSRTRARRSVGATASRPSSALIKYRFMD